MWAKKDLKKFNSLMDEANKFKIDIGNISISFIFNEFFIIQNDIKCTLNYRLDIVKKGGVIQKS